jgi:hypothetical protein
MKSGPSSPSMLVKAIKSVSYQAWTDHYYVELNLTDNTIYRLNFSPNDNASITIANGMYSNLLTALSLGKNVDVLVTTDAVVGSAPGVFGGMVISAQ